MDFTVCFGRLNVVALNTEQWQYLSWYLAALATGPDNSMGTCLDSKCTCGRDRSANFTDPVSHDVHIFLFGLPSDPVSEAHLLATTRALLYLCAGDHVLQRMQQFIHKQWDAMPVVSKAIAYTALCQLKRSALFCNDIDWFTRAVRSDEDILTSIYEDAHLTIQEKIEFMAFYFVDCAVLLPVDKWWPGARTTAQVHKELQARIPNFNLFQRTPCWAIGEFVAMAAIGLVTAAPTCLYTTKNLIDEALLPIFTDMEAQGFYFGQRSSNVIIAAREEVVLTFTMTNSPGISSLVHSLPIDAVQTVWCPAIGVMASPRCLLAWRSRVCSGTASETSLRLREIGFETASDPAIDRDSALAPRSLRCRDRFYFEIRREFRLLMNAEPTPVACLRFSKYSKTDGVAPWLCLDVAEYGRGFYCYHMHFPWASTASAGLYPIYPINHAMYFELGPVRVESRQHQLAFIPTEEMFNLLCNLVAHIPIIRGGESIEVSTYFSMAAGLTPPRGIGFLTLRPLSLQRLTNVPIALRWECVHCSF